MKSVITQKYQVHIPAKVRKATGLKPNTKVTVRAKDGKVIIEPATNSVLDLASAFAVKQPIKAEVIRNQLAYGEKK